MFKEFLKAQADNSPSLGEYHKHAYVKGEDPANVALRNEMFNAFKAGMLYSTKILDEVLAALEADLGNGKA